MKRFFCPQGNINNDRIVIRDKGEIHHISDVLRTKIDEEILVFDGQGLEYLGSIQQIKKHQVVIRVMSRLKISKRANVRIDIACAIPKKGKFDYIVEKTTEIGIDKIIPLQTKRTEVMFDKERKAAKQKHWRQIAINASKQCAGTFVPEVEDIMSFEEAASRIKNCDLCLFFCLTAQRNKISDAIKNFKNGNILIFIGPEGDFTDDEISLAGRLGCSFVSLGPRVLKVDTAAISAVSILNFVCRR